MAHIKPIRTAETQITTNDDGITVKVIEHFRQGKRFFQVISAFFRILHLLRIAEAGKPEF